MSEFGYSPRESQPFLYTLRRYLESIGQRPIADLLVGSTVSFSTDGSFSHLRSNGYAAVARFTVPVDRIGQFTELVRKQIAAAVDQVFPPEVGYDVMECQIAPFLEAPPDEELPLQNGGSLTSSGPIEHDGLRFRSKTETRIYDALKKRRVLFFANATAVLGDKNLKKEPDFLVCQDGKRGILEVMGEHYHPSATRDHERARLFKDFGLNFIEFYDAVRCYNRPEEVVSDFLVRLARF